MRRSATRALVVVMFAGAFVATPTVVRADPATPPGGADPSTAQAISSGREHFTLGVTLYRDHSYRAALVEFRKAYEVAPSYRIFYNIGQVSLELRDYATAVTAFERYLREGGAEVPPARRAEVEGQLARVGPLTGHVEVHTDVGADVFVDDIAVGTAPLAAPLVVNLGRRKLEVSKSGLPTVTRVLDVAGGDHLDVSIELAAKPSASLPPPLLDRPAPAAVAPPPPPYKPTAAWTSGGITVALAAASLVTGIIAASDKSDFDTKLATPGHSAASIDDARTAARTWALTSTVLTGAAILGGGATVYFILTSPKKDTGPASPSSFAIGITPEMAFLRARF